MSALSQKRALVTGATGFVGQTVVRHLINDSWKVSALTRKNAPTERLQRISSSIQIFKSTTNTETMTQMLREAKPEVVFHIAGHVASGNDTCTDELIRSNILFGTTLLEAMKHSGIKRFINTGTFWQHYETQAMEPVNFYAATKQAFELFVSAYVKTHGLQALTLKLFDVYGPNDPRNKLFSQFETAYQKREALSMSPGEQLLDLVYVDDVASAYLVAAERLLRNKVSQYESYAVSSGRHISLKTVGTMYQSVTRRRLQLNWGDRPYRAREVMVPWKGKTLPGWQPKVSLENGILKTVSIKVQPVLMETK